MAERPETFHFRLDDNFTSGMRRAAEAARTVGAQWERDAATWEPHDWREW